MSDSIVRLNAALEGRYQIECELGEVGMVTVYLADDLRHGRKVALRVLEPERSAVPGAERFLAEIERSAKLQHPQDLPFFDSGEADGFLFYVIPYVEGKHFRGAVGMGLIWAAAGLGVAAIIVAVSFFVTGAELPHVIAEAVMLPLVGFVGGAAFSVVLGIAEGRRRFDEMSLARFAAWGAVGGLVLFVLVGGVGGVAGASVVTLLCAGSAAGSLALARRADD